MLLRGNSGYDLAPPKDRIVGKQKLNQDTGQTISSKLPSPMADLEIKADWAGETKAQLLGAPDFLPDFVRTLPRAHIVPPRRNESRLEPSQPSHFGFSGQLAPGFGHGGLPTVGLQGTANRDAVPDLDSMDVGVTYKGLDNELDDEADSDDPRYCSSEGGSDDDEADDKTSE
ncbi:hypothetical protein BDV95DRAFT_673218 [Massariosphaeria phaeospora]|uniref:Uncharacterized protein n=1 Tax=Massariosphaeria phaeospora TaxID=100035 RepID=A0A7C8HY95_9PLEO|nr:hypothetical protein BDV95DRAFT_673218 [Massariosphaeria phaeospora]